MVSTSPLVLLSGDAVVDDNVIIEQETAVDAATVTVTQPRQSTPIVSTTRNRKQELTTVDQDHDSDFLRKDSPEVETVTPSTVTSSARPTRAAAKASAAATTAASASEASEEEAAEETGEEKESSDESKGVKRTRSGRTVSRTVKDESAGGDGEQSPTRKSARTTKK